MIFKGKHFTSYVNNIKVFAILESQVDLAWEIVAIFSLFIGLGFLIIAPK